MVSEGPRNDRRLRSRRRLAAAALLLCGLSGVRSSGTQLSLDDDAAVPKFKTPPGKRRFGGKPWCWAGMFTFELCCIRRYQPCFDDTILTYRYCCRPVNESGAAVSEITYVDPAVTEMLEQLGQLISRLVLQLMAMVIAATPGVPRPAIPPSTSLLAEGSVAESQPRRWDWQAGQGWVWGGPVDAESLAAEAARLFREAVEGLGTPLEASGPGIANLVYNVASGDPPQDGRMVTLTQRAMQLLETTMKQHLPELHSLHGEIHQVVLDNVYRMGRHVAESARAALSPDAKRPVVGRPLDLMILVAGEYGWQAMTTLNSLVYHAGSSGSVRLRVVGDAAGIASMTQALESTGLADGKGVIASVSYHNMFESIEFVQRLNTLPFACIWRHSFGQMAWARFLFPDLLPAEVERLAFIDTGDVVVLGDLPAEFPAFFERFAEGEFLGMWKPLNDPEALHPGVYLMDVAKLRQSTFTTDFVDAALAGVRKAPGLFCGLPNVDTINYYDKLYPNRVHVILNSLEWHYIPTRSWSLTRMQQYLPVGAIGALEWQHYCPTYIERALWLLMRPRVLGGAATLEQAQKIVKLALKELSAAQTDEEALALCNRPMKLLHLPGRLKREPYVQWFLGWWSRISGSGSKWRGDGLRAARKGPSEWEGIGTEAVSSSKAAMKISNDAGIVDGVDGGLTG